MIAMMRQNHGLGLVLGERGMDVGWVRSGRNGAVRLVRASRLVFEQGMTWKEPEAVGRALAELLRREGMSARQAVVGLPGRWVLAKRQVLPPVEADAAADILRLAAERDFGEQASEWVLDYAGEQVEGQGSTVMLAGCEPGRIEAVRHMGKAAGLRVVSITSTALTLAMQHRVDATERVLLCADDEGIDWVMQEAGGQVVMMGRLHGRAVSLTDRPERLTGEMRRVLAGAGQGSQGERELTVWDTTGQMSEQWVECAKALDMKVVVNPTVTRLDEKEVIKGEGVDAVRARSAAVLAMQGLVMSGVARGGLLNFDASKLAEKKASRWTQRQMTLTAVVMMGVISGLWVMGDWYVRQREITGLREDMAEVGQALKAAQGKVDKANQARLWYDQRPGMLDALRDLTMALPGAGTQGQQGAGERVGENPVWVTSLVWRDDMTGTLAGKAADEKSAMALVNRLRQSEQFAEVRLLYLRQAERNSRVVSFALTLTHRSGSKG